MAAWRQQFRVGSAKRELGRIAPATGPRSPRPAVEWRRRGTESPFAERRKKKTTPINTKSGGEATAKCARRRASNSDEEVFHVVPAYRQH